ncbi:MAG TPA: hypothetical protein VGL06_19455 [Pseudonocardiaceae bacterium]|jgi:hypothetical protein
MARSTPTALAAANPDADRVVGRSERGQRVPVDGTSGNRVPILIDMVMALCSFWKASASLSVPTLVKSSMDVTFQFFPSLFRC